MQYYLYEQCFTGHELALRTVPYTESGFSSYNKADYYRRKHRPDSMVIRQDRVVAVVCRYRESHN